MDENSTKQMTYNRIMSSFGEKNDAVYLIDKSSNTYMQIEANHYFREILGERGTLSELYETLFIRNQDNSDTNHDFYNVFWDTELFKKERHEALIELKNQGISREYMVYVVRLSESENGLILREFHARATSDSMEQEKMDALHTSYLFTMMVDLKNDTCINSNTTEVNAERQDFINLKYSDWRMMIANMFLAEDKSIFLRMSSPEYLINTLEEKERETCELQMMNMQGKYIWVRLAFTRMKNYHRDNPRFVYTVQDIQTEMQRLLKQEGLAKAIAEQNEKLQEADKAKSMFISTMSHEIRTPVNAVLGMNEMILRESNDEKILSYAREIQNASKLLLATVNDILDYSKIEAGKMKIVPVEYNLAELIQNVCNLLSAKMKEKSLEFCVDVDPGLPSRLYGDDIRVTQVISNLLSNAVKYTEKGTITLTVEADPDSKSSFACKVTVKDTGIGIKNEELELLFSDYSRLDTIRNRKIEGSGLGMGIVKGLLDQMNGKLSVKSIYGEGSEFSFTLPQKIVDQSPIGSFRLNREVTSESTFDPLEAPGKKVLVVDDTLINLVIVENLLKNTKLEMDKAQSGEECLAMMKKNHYDLILLDHLMPNMDGVETLGQIRQLSPELARTPVIALTANVTSDARDMYIGLGFDDFLEKPILTKQLEIILRRYLK